jgi:hypothetical protein
VLLCPLQNPQDLIRARTQYAEVGNQELTVWTTLRPKRRFQFLITILPFSIT